MKRWNYNTLRGEIILYFLFLSMAVFEALATFYIIWWAEPFCYRLSLELDMPGWHVFLAWVSRVVAVFYMVLFGWGFFYLAEKNESL